MKIVGPFLVVAVIVLPLQLSADGLQSMAKSIAQKTITQLNTAKVNRVAIVPFVPTQEHYLAKNELGNYVSEAVLNAFPSNVEHIKTFERKRLDAVMEELAFSQNVLLSAGEVEKIGELISVDYIITGSWTDMNNTIVINARCIDVATGEVVFPMTIKGELAKKEVALIGRTENDTPASSKAYSGKTPESLWNTIDQLLTPPLEETKVSKASALLIAIPFDSTGVAIHRKAILRLISLKRAIPQYGIYLGESLRMSDPAGALEYQLRDYFAIEGTPTDERWQELVQIITRSSQPDQLLLPLFTAQPLAVQGEQQLISRLSQFIENGQKSDVKLSRYDLYCHAVSAIGGEWSQSKGLDEETIRNNVIFALADSFSIESTIVSERGAMDSNQRSYKYEQIIKKAIERESATTGIFPQSIYNRLISLYKKLPINEYTAFSILYLDGFLQELAESKEQPESVKTRARQLKESLGSTFASEIATSFPLVIPSNSQSFSFVRFGVAHGIALDSLIPSVESLQTRLIASTPEDELIHLSILLGEAGKRAMGAEEKSARLLERSTRLGGKKSHYLAGNLATFLKSIEASQPATFRAYLSVVRFCQQPALSESVRQQQELFSRADSLCREAIIAGGKTAAIVYMNDLKQATNPLDRRALLTGLSLIGKECSSVSKELRAFAGQTLSVEERDLVNDILDQIDQ